MATDQHDKFIKRVLSVKQNAEDFLSNYLPKDVLKILDPFEIEIVKDSFVDKALKSSYSDMLYRVKTKRGDAYVYFLFEHKSYRSETTALQLLGYMVEIWKMHLKQAKKGANSRTLPIIIPIVIYHGSEKWKPGTTLADMASGPKELLAEYVPDFKFILNDLTRMKDDEIKGRAFLKTALFLLKYVRNPEFRRYFPMIAELINSVLENDRENEIFFLCMTYVMESTDAFDIRELISIVEEKISSEKGGEVMTIAEKLMEKGMQKGLQEGLQKGLQEGLQKGLQKGLQEGLQEGLQKGLQKGKIVAAREDILEILEMRFDSIQRNIILRINKIDDMNLLRKLLKAAVKSENIGEFADLLKPSK